MSISLHLLNLSIEQFILQQTAYNHSIPSPKINLYGPYPLMLVILLWEPCLSLTKNFLKKWEKEKLSKVDYW